jgi:hypothetical protein
MVINESGEMKEVIIHNPLKHSDSYTSIYYLLQHFKKF